MSETTDAVWAPTGISCSSGGVRMLGHLGVLAHLSQSGLLTGVKDWYGCSAGSFCAFFGAIGVSASWIADAVEYFDTRALGNFDEETVTNFMTGWGFSTLDTMITIVGSFADTWEPGASTWTFADLRAKRPGISLTVIATNVTRGCLGLFDYEHTPDLVIMDALRASSSIPLFFTPWVSPQGEYFCDGAMLEYYPWSCVKNKESTLVIACSDTGISGRHGGPQPITSLAEFVGRLGKILQHKHQLETPRFWIAVNNKTIGIVDFDMTKEERKAIYEEGVIAAKRWLQFRSSVEIRPQACSPGRHACLPKSDLHYTARSSHLSPACKSGNPPPYADQGALGPPSAPPHSGKSRPCRRWSL